MFVNIFSNYDCGNFWASPKHYFYNYKKSQSYEIDNLKSKITSKSLIFSGGSINKILLSQINDIKNENIKIDFISWGLGINIFDYTKQNTLIGNISKSKKIFVNYLINFTLKGSRDFQSRYLYEWIPCASCMHPYFQKFKQKKPKKKLGVYYDHNLIFKIKNVEESDYMSNYGIDIEEKLNFISNYEMIITNNYHGVYWAQLLNVKVICLPVKSSLLNFRYNPIYLKNQFFKILGKNGMIKIDEKLYDQVKNTPNFLEECIEANIQYSEKVNSLIDK